MKIWDAKVAEMIMDNIMNGMSEKEAVVNGLIMEMAIPWNSTASVVEIYNVMMACDAPEEHEWAVVDGVLFRDGESIKRVGAKERYFVTNDAFATYWEDRCLSMGCPVD